MRSTLLTTALVGLAAAHGDHAARGAPKVDENANWMTKHMAEEHHMEGWDAGAFFALHDYNSDGKWQGDELLRTYGLMDESNKDVPNARRKEIMEALMSLMDTNNDREISGAEWLAFVASGQTLPDMGTGPGHHGDDEYEYEIHHWEKYHGEDTKLEDLTHPEDIEHFKKHEQMEEAEERLEAMERLPVVEANIPLKFRKQQR
ncbi:uncharacterized protein F5Z01DRAFT_509148 [Emericellopsis atlantica]|uniref:EF-hand domain-containing protein n=1 Tax=Emericellopsis atlantica TaxID=2614577 RepID=A0A9P7ZRM3_9HYPO|nr:uncharacterized protein F5Z01DRAFT_509148 [Emericellopsis atlantica]KAG9256415.1 hypothetical protein F5Z01DRAFT_509148 [Emericellopsis atlantica]